MPPGKNKVTVTIFGDSYVVLGSDDPRYIENVAALVDKKMRLIAQRSPSLTPVKVAVLAALNLADELTKLQQEQRAVAKVLDEEKE